MPLASLAKPLVVYFYPKDDTSGCTREAIDFSQHLKAAFEVAGVGILGVSKDSPKAHDEVHRQA
jgi:peroxiredoxin Q/BCP